MAMVAYPLSSVAWDPIPDLQSQKAPSPNLTWGSAGTCTKLTMSVWGGRLERSAFPS